MKSVPGFSSTMCAITLMVMLAARVDAQTRYKDIVFPSATTTAGVEFGSNLNVDGSSAILLLDLYEPTGDTVQSRPLIVFIHGGSLTSGGRSAMATFCIDAAKRGYVAATIDYRLGIASPKGVPTILEELLRGVQDTKAAVRFLKSKASDYGIDTTKIFLYGSSAGSMVAVHYAYWDQDEIPPEVDQTTWGDIEGASGSPGHSSEVHGIVNYVGAIMEPSWIDADEVPVANFHGLLDPVVPPDSGVSTDFGVLLYGGVRVGRVATQLGIYTQGSFFPNMAHGGNEDSLRTFAANFLYSLITLSSVPSQDLTAFQLSDDSLRLFLYDRHVFTASALDPAGNRIMLPSSMVQYACDPSIGSIAPSGIYSPTQQVGSGYVYATFEGTTDSCHVEMYDFAYFVLRPKLVVTDTTRPVVMRIETYDADSVLHELPITMFTLTSTEPSVGTIDAHGTFRGLMNGTTRIVASLNAYSDTSTVRVESAGGTVWLDQFDDLSGWTWEGSNLDSLSVNLTVTTGQPAGSSVAIYYSLTYDPARLPFMVYLNTDTPIYGIPDSVYIDARTDGRRHRVYYRFEDAEGAAFRALGLKYLNDSVSFSMINAAMLGLTPLSGTAQVSYPLTLKRIEIQLAPATAAGAVTSGTIQVDGLRLKYPGDITGVSTAERLPGEYVLEQNYPNPFNPTTTVGWKMPVRGYVRVSVTDLLGREVSVLVHEELSAGRHTVTWNATSMPSGVYFLRLEAGTSIRVQKVVLLR